MLNCTSAAAELCISQALHALPYCTFMSYAQGNDSRRTAKKCCWTTSSPQRTSLQHIWSLSIVHQVSSLVAHRRIKTTRSSLLFNYSITQKETVITWNITKSRRVRSVLSWRRAEANWQHLQTLLRHLCKGGRFVREMHHSAVLQPEQTAAS